MPIMKVSACSVASFFVAKNQTERRIPMKKTNKSKETSVTKDGRTYIMLDGNIVDIFTIRDTSKCSKEKIKPNQEKKA